MNIAQNSHQAPLISVIVPCYNHARFLEERMESILGQTYQNIEVIILDDCSTDNSREIIERYRQDKRVTHIVYNEVNTGKPFLQWRKGMELAKGEICWIAESDDSCDKRMLERLVKEYTDNNCVYAFCRLLFTNEDGDVTGMGQGGLGKDTVTCWDGKAFINRHLHRGNFVCNASGCIFSREEALSVNRQYEGYKGSGDWLFWIEMAEKGRVSFDNRAMNYCRRHGDNVTERNYSNGVDMLEDYTIMQYCYQSGLITKRQQQMMQRDRILTYLYYPFDTNAIRKHVLKVWGYRGITRLRVFFWRAFTSLAARV